MSDLRLAAARDQEKFFYRSGPSDSSSPIKQHLQPGEQPRKAEAGRQANQGVHHREPERQGVAKWCARSDHHGASPSVKLAC